MSVTPQQPPTAAAVFISEPIDLASGPGRSGYQIVRALSDLGFTCFRPATAWNGGAFNPQLVESTNRQVLFSSNAIVADLSENVRSFGVPMEIEAATARDIPAVVLVDPSRSRSVSLQANKLVTFAETWGDAVALANKAAQTHWAHNGRKVESPALKVTMALGTEPPRLAFVDDAGFDLVTAVDTVVPGKSFVDVPTTVTGVQSPPGTWLLITGRSSTVRKRGLLVPNGIIDHGWRGPLFAGVYNLTDEPVTILAGERVAQAILMGGVTEHHPIRQVEKLDPHERGLAGFGSTGGTGNDGAVKTVVGLRPADYAQYLPTEAELGITPVAAAVPRIEWCNPTEYEMFPWRKAEAEELESLRETVAILSDPGAVADFADGEADMAAGRTVDVSELPWASEGERLQALEREAARGHLAEFELQQLENATSEPWPPAGQTDDFESTMVINAADAGPTVLRDEVRTVAVGWASEGERMQALASPGWRQAEAVDAGE